MDMTKGRKVCSVVIIAAIALFLFLLRYDVPLYGDDVGGLVVNNPDNTYLDDRVVTGECELNLDFSLKANWSKIYQSYFAWDGRVVAKFVKLLILMIFSLPDRIDWLLYSIYIAGMLLFLFLLTIRSICGSLKAGVEEPILMILTGVLLFCVPSYAYAYMSRLVMYTFVDIYVISAILYLAFYMAIRSAFEGCASVQADNGNAERRSGRVCRTRTLIGINLLGMLAGLSHEAYGVIFGAVLLTQLLRFWLVNHRRISVRRLLLYPGYLIGFCICFFAPGNFNRVQQSHESALRTVSVLTRFLNSIYVHAFVAYQIWIFPIVILPVLAVVLFVLLYRRKLDWKEVLMAFVHNLEWFAGFAMSAVTWGIVARVVSYGMLAANVLLIIGVLRTFRELWRLAADRIWDSEKRYGRVQTALAGISIVIVMCLFGRYYTQMSEAHHTADAWRENIGAARKAGAEEVTVPAYPKDLDLRFYELSYINDQEKYDKIAMQVVYGTHIVLDESNSE